MRRAAAAPRVVLDLVEEDDRTQAGPSAPDIPRGARGTRPSVSSVTASPGPRPVRRPTISGRWTRSPATVVAQDVERRQHDHDGRRSGHDRLVRRPARPSASGRARRSASIRTRVGPARQRVDPLRSQPFELVLAHAPAQHRRAAVGCAAPRPARRRRGPSASTRTGPVMASGSIPMCVVVVTITRQPALRASSAERVDEASSFRPLPPPPPRRPGRSPAGPAGPSRPGVLAALNRPALHVAGHDDVRSQGRCTSPQTPQGEVRRSWRR